MIRTLLTIVIAVGFVGCQKAEQKAETFQTASIEVKTIKCEMCVKNVAKALESVEGVKKTEVDLKEKVAKVEFVPAKTNLASLESAIAKAGYTANQTQRDAAAYESLPQCCQ